jgi:hypothetical protein
MIARFINYISGGITPAQLDGALYIMIAVCGAVQTFFSSDEAYKYINPYILFYIKCGAGIVLAAVGALKMFRSTTYSDHLKDKKDEETKKIVENG